MIEKTMKLVASIPLGMIALSITSALLCIWVPFAIIGIMPVGFLMHWYGVPTVITSILLGIGLGFFSWVCVQITIEKLSTGGYGRQ